MNLILEIKYPSGNHTDRHELENGVYVIGSGDESDKGKAIKVDSPFVNRDQAQIEFTRAGWAITALKPQIRVTGKGNQLLDVGDLKKIGPNSNFVIGNIEISFLAPKEVKEVVRVKQERLGATLDYQISDLHLRLTKETQLLTRIERPNTEDLEYKAQVLSILENIVDQYVSKLPTKEIHELAADAGRRDMIYRVLGDDGVLSADRADDKVSEKDRLDFDKIQRDLAVTLSVTFDGKNEVETLASVNTNYEKEFARASKNFANTILKLLIRQTIVQSVTDVVFGIGPLEYLRENDNISEIMVVSAAKIFVELNGNLVETGLSFVDEKSAQTITSYIVGRVGKQINVQNPYEDARLEDGSRVNAVVSPIAIDGTALTIRKFGSNPLTVKQLIGFGCLSEAMASFLEACVISKKNIVVSGGTGTGKTTMVNWLASMIPPDERIVTAEDVAELRFELPHVVRLEARPASSDGDGEVTIRDLVKNALRMRPDRVVIGECRGGEAFDMLQAMNTGHEGSMTTLHANNGVEAMSRMENLVLMADQGLPIDAIRYQISGAVDFVVQLKRYANGARKISEICEVGDIDSHTGRVEVNPIFETHYDHTKENAPTYFSFAGRTPEGIESIIKAGFNASFLSF